MERVRALNSNSGNVVSYGWEETPSQGTAVGTLSVEFAGRMGKTSVYEYLDVTQSDWRDLLQSHSAGHFINERIKPNYPVRKVQ